MTGLLLVGVAVSLASQATPIGREGPSVPDAVRVEGTNLDRRLIGEVAQEMLRSGSGVTPSLLGIDEAFLGAGSMLHGEQLREEISDRVPLPGRPRPVRNLDAGGPDIVNDTLSSALRATRDAFFEDGDTANFSLAGMDLNVTLKGDRRGLSINGYEVLASNQQGYDVLRQMSSDSERKPGGDHSDTLVRQYAGERNELSLAEIRKFISDPMTIVGALAFLGAWLVLAMASRRG